MGVARLNHFEHVNPKQAALKKRHFLMLQGVSSPFFSQLAKRLIDCGHAVHKISFNSGDLVYSSSLNARWFRQSLEQLPTFLADIYDQYGVTDQILFGDRRPIHVIAVEQARLFCIKNHVFEEGYFRPYWITLEREGVNSRSLFPKSAQWVDRAFEHLNHTQNTFQSFQSPFWKRAWHDVHYHSAGIVNSVLFPRYRTHSNITAPTEYRGYLKRFPKLSFVKNHESEWLRKLVTTQSPYFLLPLQLNSDSQVRDQELFNSMPVLIEYVVSSFAQHAPAQAILVIKNHPLDTGLTPYENLIGQLANKYDLQDRIKFIETGDLNLLLQHALGVVTLNSTVGLVALEQGCPTLALGEAIYNFKGLTAQCDLDHFWLERPVPVSGLYQKFKHVLLNTTQINGGFYSPQAIGLAAPKSAEVLCAQYSPLELLMQQVSQ